MNTLASAMGGARATGEDWRDRYQTPRGVIDHVHRVLGSIALDEVEDGSPFYAVEVR